MPVRHFDIFTVERSLLQHSPLPILKGTRVGIDGNYWLRRLLRSEVRETFSVAMGSVPLDLTTAIERDLRRFEAAGIQPVFVFSGVAMARKDKPFSREDLRPGRRARAWNWYYEQHTDSALTQWRTSSSVNQQDQMWEVLRILREHNVEFMRAPYAAWGQLVYLQQHPQAPIQAIHAGTEIVVFDVDRVIVGFDFDKGTFSWMSKRAALKDLQLTTDQFLDVCILAGFDWSTTFPPLTTSMGFSFKAVHDMVKQYKSGSNVVQQHADNPEVIKHKYVDIFCRARCAVKNHLILNDEGHVVPLSTDNAPTDLHEVLGYRLPESIYYCLAKGLVGTPVINNLVSGMLLETAPLCNGETNEYRQLLKDLLPLRTTTLALLSKSLHHFYQNRKVVSIYYFEPTVEHNMAHAKASIHPTVVESSTVSVSTGAMPTLYDALTKFLTPGLVAAQKQDTKEPLHGPAPIVASALLTMLVESGFVDAQYKPTEWGDALLAGLRCSGPNATAHSAELLATLMLVRHKVLKPQPFSIEYTPASSVPVGSSLPVATVETLRAHQRLIARTVGILPIQTQSSPWAGPLNRDLLAYSSGARAVTKTLRNLAEMATLNLFLHGKAQLSNGDNDQQQGYLTVALHLPFSRDPDDAMSLVTFTYLDHIVQQLSAASPAKPLTIKAEALKAIQATFTSVSDPVAQLKGAFQFWDQVVVAAQLLGSAGTIDESLTTAFTAAQKWARPYYP
ncbi:hypothetical protein H4R34_002858 [Dimargaris verticillata]|uniref:XPG-I domain-containing protein n=1 Tax=Dimargaris verticillata TaxID=2761393 RepID=A0A9W8B8P7_9FUNG|nr:hypothetical protein H4R34_002858 [Dimargaris verticillata]